MQFCKDLLPLFVFYQQRAFVGFFVLSHLLRYFDCDLNLFVASELVIFLFAAFLDDRLDIFVFFEIADGGARFFDRFRRVLADDVLLEVTFLQDVFTRIEDRDLVGMDENGSSLDVGRYADRLDRNVAGSEIFGDRELHSAAAGSADYRLHASFAEALSAEHCRSAVLFERRSDDLCRRSRTFVYHDDYRNVEYVAAFFLRIVHFDLLIVFNCRNDDAFVEEEVTDRYSLGEKSSRIVAHVENECLHSFLFKSVELFDQSGVGVFHEARKVDISYPGLRHCCKNGGDLDDRSRDLEFKELRNSFAPYHKCYLRAGFASHFADCLVESEVYGRSVVDLDDNVVRLDARFCSRSSLHWRYDGDLSVVVHSDNDAETSEISACGLLEIVKILRREKV